MYRLFQRLYKISSKPNRKIYNMCRTYATIRISLSHNFWDIAEKMGHESPEILDHKYGGFIGEYQALQMKK
ncbi:MAG: hypothetical protein ACI808_001635 [Paraglaciecola sp.]|jgi:hypothetical protein